MDGIWEAALITNPVCVSAPGKSKLLFFAKRKKVLLTNKIIRLWKMGKAHDRQPSFQREVARTSYQ